MDALTAALAGLDSKLAANQAQQNAQASQQAMLKSQADANAAERLSLATSIMTWGTGFAASSAYTKLVASTKAAPIIYTCDLFATGIDLSIAGASRVALNPDASWFVSTASGTVTSMARAMSAAGSPLWFGTAAQLADGTNVQFLRAFASFLNTNAVYAFLTSAVTSGTLTYICGPSRATHPSTIHFASGRLVNQSNSLVGATAVLGCGVSGLNYNSVMQNAFAFTLARAAGMLTIDVTAVVSGAPYGGDAFPIVCALATASPAAVAPLIDAATSAWTPLSPSVSLFGTPTVLSPAVFNAQQRSGPTRLNVPVAGLPAGSRVSVLVVFPNSGILSTSSSWEFEITGNVMYC